MGFHTDREPLHGVTVVLSGTSGRTYLGRYHERTPRGVLLHDVGVHDPAEANPPLEEWLATQRRFGIKVTHRHVMVPTDEVGNIEAFGS